MSGGADDGEGTERSKEVFCLSEVEVLAAAGQGELFQEGIVQADASGLGKRVSDDEPERSLFILVGDVNLIFADFLGIEFSKIASG